MTNLNFRTFVLGVICLLLAVAPVSAASYTPIEAARAHTAAGAFGCTVSGATNATPIVVTCAAAHKLIDGDAIQITGVGGNTNANTVGYAKITGYSTTTFGFYSDSALATGIAGNASYTSGGAVTTAYDISGITGDWTIRVNVDGLTSGKKVLLAIQDSVDGFASDIRTIATVNLTGTVPATGVAQTFRSYQLPSARFGTTSARLRLYVMAIDSATTATVSFGLEQ